MKTELFLLTQDDIPYINPCIYAFQDSQYLYMVSSYIEGYTLQEIFEKKHEFNENEGKYVMMTLISIIDGLHRKGYVFGELSPRNFIIDLEKFNIKVGFP